MMTYVGSPPLKEARFKKSSRQSRDSYRVAESNCRKRKSVQTVSLRRIKAREFREPRFFLLKEVKRGP